MEKPIKKYKMIRYTMSYMGETVIVLAENEKQAQKKAYDLIMWKVKQRRKQTV